MTRNRPTSKSDIAIDSCGDVVRFAQDGAKKAGESNHWENSRLMKAAFVLVLTALPVALPLGGAFAAPAVTANVDVLVGSAQINDAASDLIAVVAAEIDVTVGANNKNIEQGIVNVAKAAAPVTCTTVAFTGCPAGPVTQVVLDNCSDTKTYTIVPGGVGVGSLTDGGAVDGTVTNGNISATCKSR